MTWLERFVAESNRIEGIHREPLPAEIAAHEDILALDRVGVSDVEGFVAAVQPGAALRNKVGLDVRVGGHLPPRGGLEVPRMLESVLVGAQILPPYISHVAYENLHPFTDGNGRSGPALWLWQMMHGTMRQVNMA